ncbi:hypothetical protein E4U38_008464 [Claviceps purpurea]|nr:hypothetical protein E4U38_008464 [Claviceps purpurea]KAG6153065.1 hypothetical protein E4U11_007146 [Claviceps purpurea]
MGPTGRRTQYQNRLTGNMIGWTEEEEETLFKLKKEGKNWQEVAAHFPGKTERACMKFYYKYRYVQDEFTDEIKGQVASLYESNKERMWAKIAEEMKVPWTEAELNHWRLGSKFMAKRAGDKSFLTREERFQYMPCIGLPPPPVVEAEAQENVQQKDIGYDEWSGTETNTLSECTEAGMDWKEVSRRLPGRTAEDCEKHYYRQLNRAGGWPPELQTELSRLYQSTKSEMWTEIGNQLQISWKSAEDIHWTVGAVFTVQIVQPAANLSPSQVQDDEVDQHQHH